MTTSLHPLRRLWWLAEVLFLCRGNLQSGPRILNDGFETGAFASARRLTRDVVINNFGSANRRTRFANLLPSTAASGRELGARFASVLVNGAKNFAVALSFRIPSPAQSQFHLHISTCSAGISSSAPALSLRYQSGWATYDGGFNPFDDLEESMMTNPVALPCTWIQANTASMERQLCRVLLGP